ncbi:helix-turn-helix domain-containing protein [Pantoea sp. SGAir0183]
MSDSGEVTNTAKKAERVSLKKLSELSGLSARQLSRMEAGSKTTSDSTTVVKIANSLGVSVEEILGEKRQFLNTVESNNNQQRSRTTFAVSMVEKTKLEIIALKLEEKIGCKVRWTDILHRMIDDIDLEKTLEIFTSYVNPSD